MISNKRLESAALRACRSVGVPGDKAQAEKRMMTHEGGYSLRIDHLPEEVRRAGAAILHAAIAHSLMHPEDKPPKTMQWAGRRWYLTHWCSRRVHVSGHIYREDGLVSGYGGFVP